VDDFDFELGHHLHLIFSRIIHVMVFDGNFRMTATSVTLLGMKIETK
jgi:hypothetical protein